MRFTVSQMVSAGVFSAIVAGAATLGYVTGASAQQPYPQQTMPKILTGDDIRFQTIGSVTRDSKGNALGDSIQGVLMVRLDGRWVVAHVQDGFFGGGVRPLSQ
jgi:hypothetical protein